MPVARHNQDIPIQIGTQVIKPTHAMHFLGVWLGLTLHWQSHLDAVAGKMKTQLQALTCLSASTWGLPLTQACLVHGMVIQPAMTYGAIAWHQPQGITGLHWGLNQTLAPYQNHCLWVITRAYQATPVSTLEAETYIPPLNLHLDSLVAQTTQHLEDSGMAANIEGACQAVHCYLQAHGQNQHRPYTQYIHPHPLPWGWQSQWTQNNHPA